MNIRVKAALMTAGILAGTGVIFLAIGQILSVLTAEQIQMVFGIAFVGLAIYMLYAIMLNRLEYEACMKKIQDQRTQK